MSAARIAYVVCDDSQTGAELQTYLRELGWSSSIFTDSRSFLKAAIESVDVSFALVDYLSSSGEPALQLLQALEDADVAMPLVLVTRSPSLSFLAEATGRGAAGILMRPTSRFLVEQAMKLAVEFKPVLELRHQIRQYAKRLAQLTEREKNILRLAVEGWPNKRIAALLDVSVKTIERSRKFAYQKLNVRSSAEMARVVTLGSMERTMWPKVSVLGPAAIPEPHVAPINAAIPPVHFANQH